MDITFANPVYLWMLLIVPLLILLHFFTLNKNRRTALKFSNFEALKRVSDGEFLAKPYTGFLKNKNPLLLLLRMAIYMLLILAVSGATLWYVGETTSSNYVVTIDSSASMLADDLDPNRLEATKSALVEFLESMPSSSKVGIISFGGVAKIIDRPDSEMSEKLMHVRNLSISETGGTNIGDAIMAAANLIDNSNNEESGIIVLLTDGRSNVGTPVSYATEFASSNNYIVNTIGIGTKEGGEFLGEGVISTIDEESLQDIASTTGGKFYRVTAKEDLAEAFEDILQTTEKRLSLELSWILLLVGLIMLALEWVLMNTRYRTIP